MSAGITQLATLSARFLLGGGRAWRSAGAATQYGFAVGSDEQQPPSNPWQRIHQYSTDAGVKGRFVQTIKGININISAVGKPEDDGLTLATTAESVPSETHDASKPKSEGPRALVMGWYSGLKDLLQTTFMPAGYPKTVGDNYMQYILWQGVSNFAVTANSVLASTFLLYSVGLGAGAIPTASALNWVLKDGLGQMGTLVFGKMVAHNFDIHSKAWYFLSMVKLKLATLLEILTILWPQHFLIMGSVANSVKGLAFMASGSTRSVFNLSFAKDNNIADITAKSTSQYIFASLFGTAAGASMCTYVGQDFHLAALCYGLLTATTLVSAYKTVTAIPLATLNSSRLQLLSEKFLSSVHMTAKGTPRHLDSCYVDTGIEYDRTQDEAILSTIPGPVQLAPDDPPLPGLMGDERLTRPSIILGSSLDRCIQGNPQLLLLLLATFKYTHYIILPATGAIHVILHHSANSRDICQAFLQATILRRRLKDGAKLHMGEPAELRIALQDTLLTAERLTTPFMTALSECGWKTEKIVVEAEKRRAQW